MPANFTGSLAISGSLLITGSIQTTGGITISGSIASASYALSSSNASNAELLDNLDSTAFVFTSSYNVASSSLSTRVTKIEGNYATTGSNAFNGSQNITGSLTVSQAVIAQTLNVQQVTSSIVYSCGSNIFGCSTSDVQQITGSLRATGSIATFSTNCFGIGTSTPLAYNNYVALTVGDNSTTKTGLIKLRSCYNAGDGAEIYQTSAGTLTVATNGSDSAFRIFSNNIATFTCQVCAPSLVIPNTVRIGTTYGSSAQFSFGSTTGAQTTANLTDAGVQCGILEVLATGGAAGNGSALMLGSDTWGTGVGKGQIALKALLINGSGCGTSDLAFSLRNDPACSNLTERMRITSSGNVGINTTVPSTKLHICNPVNQAYSPTSFNGAPSDLHALHIQFCDQNQRAGLIRWTSHGNLENTFGVVQIGCSTGGTGCGQGDFIFQAYKTDPSNSYSELMRITRLGNVGIGTTSPQGRLESKTANIALGDAAYAKKAFVANLPFTTSNVIASGLSFFDSSIHGADIGYSYDGTGYYMALATNDNTTGDPIERMRITSAGRVDFTEFTRAKLYQIYTEGAFRGGLYNYVNASGGGTDYSTTLTSETAIYFTPGGSATKALSILTTGISCFGYTVCAPCFATISDYRMKSNLRPIDGLSIIMNTKPYKFEYNYDCSTSFGMIAHELQEIVPEAVFGVKDGETMQGVDYMKLLPIAIKSIQEQQCQICSQATIIHQLKTCLGMA